MANTSVYSTSTSDRPCEADNPLTCRVHGVAGEFTEVPTFVADNADRARSLREQTADAKSALVDQAVQMGVRLSDVGYITHDRNRAAEYRSADVDALTNLEDEYREAVVEEDAESDYRAASARGYVAEAIKQEFPHATARERTNLTNLVGLRFFGVENGYSGSFSVPGEGSLDDIYRSIPGYFPGSNGPTREELFAPLAVPENRAKLRKIDRGYFTALSGRIPTEEQLSEVAHQRALRRVSAPRDYMLDETFALVSDLAAID